jgi:hypothetical protein
LHANPGNWVGQAFLPVLLPVALQSFEQQSEDFPYLISNFSFARPSVLPHGLVSNGKWWIQLEVQLLKLVVKSKLR